MTAPRHWTLLGVPSSAGARRTGQERAPAALRAAGLLERLQKAGCDVVDGGDLPVVTFAPDPEQPRQQNVGLVLEVARQTADAVDRVLTGGRLPVVLGGDCSLGLGVIAGLLRHQARLGLVYFDGDLDLNTPSTTSSGIFDGMVMAHILGRGVPELAGLGPRTPLLDEEDIVLFGYDVDSGWIDPPELEVLERLRSTKYPLARVRANPAAAAREALRDLEGRSDAILVHFDVDVTDLPAAEVVHPQGLDVASAFAALEVFAAAPTLTAIVVTEFNPEQDPDGAQCASVIEGLVEALGARRKSAD